jgi:hypothetical protein
MPSCPIHPDQYWKPDQPGRPKGFCTKCNNENIELLRQSEKQKRKDEKVIRFKKYEASKKSVTRKRLLAKLQNLVAARFKKRFKGTNLFYCWISGKKPAKDGLFGIHCSHYYARHKIWQLSNEPHNVFPSCYNENVVNQSSVTSARGMMEKVYGVEAMQELDRKAEYYKDAMNKGIENKRPTELQILAMIEECKRQIF